MNRLLSIAALMLLLTLPSYKSVGNEDDMFLNFIAAIENESTFDYFTVIKVKDMNTGLTKEVCTKGNFVSGALHIELNAGYDSKGIQRVLNFAKNRRSRYFEFKNKKALENISFYNYNSINVFKIQSEFDFNKIDAIIRKDKKYSISLPNSKVIYFAHILFNRGILTGESSCFGGKLEYVDRNKGK